jgi:hypothetical protein
LAGENKKRRPEIHPGVFWSVEMVCYSLIAFTGHVSTQAPQSMQVASSITLLLPDSLIAPTGQESSHAPQLMHSSEMV